MAIINNITKYELPDGIVDETIDYIQIGKDINDQLQNVQNDIKDGGELNVVLGSFVSRFENLA